MDESDIYGVGGGEGGDNEEAEMMKDLFGDDGDDGEGADMAPPPPKRGGGRKRQRKTTVSQPKRKKKPVASRYYEDEAAGGGMEDEEEDMRGAEAGFEEHARDVLGPRETLRTERGYFDNSASVEDVVRGVEERNRQLKMRRERIIQEGAVARARPLPQRSNRLYAVKVVEGSEAEAVIRLMRKFMHQRDGVPILSAAASGTRGVVYVEAHHDAHVKRAVDGLELFRHYLRGGVKRVPVDEMITAVAPKMEHTPVEAGKFVRVKRGVYQGDLARVEEVVDDQTVILRLMPRIDLTAAASSVGVAGQRKRSKAGRPPRRRFLPDEVGDVGNVERKRPPWGQEVLDHFAGKYFDAGFQVLTMPMSRLQTSNVLPQTEEMEEFAALRRAETGGADDDEEGGGVKEEVAEDQVKASFFGVGDLVRVVKGALKDQLMGEVTRIDIPNDQVFVKPIEPAGLEGEYEFPSRELCKHFRTGTHVKIMRGRYREETGSVTDVKEIGGRTVAFILTDMDRREVQVAANALERSMEVHGPVRAIGGFKLHDAVMLAQLNQVGVIVHVGRDRVSVLNTNGQVERVAVQQVKEKMRRRQSTVEGSGMAVSPGDMVEVIEGPYASQRGTVHFIYHDTLFLRSTQHLENSGVFVAKRTQVRLTGADVGRQRRGAASAVVAAPIRLGTRDDAMVGKMVQVTRGKYRKLFGKVKRSTGAKYTVELLGKHKSVTLPTHQVRTLAEHETKTGGAQAGMRGGGAARAGMGALAGTPAYQAAGAATPHGRATPGGVTPGGVTPGGATPHGENAGGASVWEPDEEAETPHYDPRHAASGGMMPGQGGMSGASATAAATGTPVTPSQFQPTPYTPQQGGATGTPVDAYPHTPVENGGQLPGTPMGL